MGNFEQSQIYVDGTEIGNVSSSVIKERHILASDGIIIITIVTAEGMLLKKPEIITKGFIKEENVAIVKLLQKDVSKQVNRMLKQGLPGKEIQIALQKNLKNYSFKLTGMNPLIVVQVMDV